MRDVTPFLEISMFPDLLNNSNPPLSAIRSLEINGFKEFYVVRYRDRVVIWVRTELL